VGAGADHLFFLTFFAERLFVGVEEQSDCHPAVRTVPASVGDPCDARRHWTVTGPYHTY
jgi:hypothetical protein